MYKKHEFNFFPEIQNEEFETLKNSISAGFDDKLGKIILFEGCILDGWNRYRACNETDIKPVFENFKGTSEEAFKYSIKANQDRRHLNKSQLACIAVDAEPIWKAIQEEVEKIRRRKIAEARAKQEAEKKERKRLEELRKIEAIKRENERKQREQELKERAKRIADKLERQKIEAEKIRIEQERERERKAEIERVENEKREKEKVSEMTPSDNTKRKSRTKLANTFGVAAGYISEAKKLKEENPEAFEEIKGGDKTITEVKKEEKKKKLKLKVSESRIKTAIIENIKNGDSLEILETLKDRCIDIVLTDPPYGINYISNRSIYDNAITKRGLLNDSKNKAFDLLDKTCQILQRKTAENSHLYFFCNWAVFSSFEAIIGKYFNIKTPIIWDKGNKGSGDLDNDWGNQTEIIIYCVKGKKLVNKRRGNIINVPKIHSSKMIHPTQKPIELKKQILEVSAVKGDFIVDPFMGSGSSIKACNELGYKSLGIELDPDMFNIANNFING